MSEPPAIIVHGLRDIRAVQATGRAATLLSPPGAGIYAGCGWWAALLAAAGGGLPAFLDCADAPGRAWEGLKLGLRGIILAPCPAWAQVAEYAAAQGALLRPAAPPALDLATPGARRRLTAWVTGNYSPGTPAAP